MKTKLGLAPILSLLLLASACGGGAPATGFTAPNNETAAATYANRPAGATYPISSDLCIQELWVTPNPARVGQPVEVWTNLYMADFLIAFVIGRLEVNGVLLDRARWTVYLDESDAFSFTYTPTAPGIYKIRVTANLEENEAFYQQIDDLSLSESETLTVT
jgi:hypothetical protein